MSLKAACVTWVYPEGTLPIEEGLPITVKGEFVGAIGVNRIRVRKLHSQGLIS